MKNKSWFLDAGIAVLGLLFILFPEFWIRLVVILLGLGAIAYGIYNLKFTRSLIDNYIYDNVIMIKSIASIVIGAFALIFPMAIGGAMWSAMIYILAIYLLLSAITGFYAASLLKDSNIDRKRYFLENLVLVAAAVILFLIGPNQLAKGIIRFAGVALILFGGFMTFLNISSSKNGAIDVEVKEQVESESDKE